MASRLQHKFFLFLFLSLLVLPFGTAYACYNQRSLTYTTYSFEGHVANATPFSYYIKPLDLYFHIVPKGTGWMYYLNNDSSQKQDDYIYPVNLPHQNNALQYIDDRTNKDPLKWKERPFLFVYTPEHYRIAYKSAQNTVWDGAKDNYGSTQDFIDQHPMGRGIFTIINGTSRPVDQSPSDIQITSIDFQVTLNVPQQKTCPGQK